MMTLTPPAWLGQHGGALRAGTDGRTWFVDFAGEPQYRLVPVPVAGRYGCQITQTINGRRMDSAGVYPSTEEALRGGLEDLRQALGW